MRGPLRLLVLAAALAPAGCGPTVDLSQGLQVLDVSTGWHDAGLSNGMNKLVPQVRFTLKNVSERSLASLQANVVFRHGQDTEDWGSAFLTVAGSEGLAPGASSEPLVATSNLGYTGMEARADMLQNSQFVDARVDIFAKYASTQWVKVGEYPIDRRLLTQ
jgi:hypothetical protein